MILLYFVQFPDFWNSSLLQVARYDYTTHLYPLTGSTHYLILPIASRYLCTQPRSLKLSSQNLNYTPSNKKAYLPQATLTLAPLFVYRVLSSQFLNTC